MELAVIGGSAFTLGFGLSGVRTIRNVEGDASMAFRELMARPEIGIVLTDQITLDQLPEHIRQGIQASVKPVIVVVSTGEGAQDALRKMIKKSIGVDLWV